MFSRSKNTCSQKGCQQRHTLVPVHNPGPLRGETLPISRAQPPLQLHASDGSQCAEQHRGQASALLKPACKALCPKVPASPCQPCSSQRESCTQHQRRNRHGNCALSACHNGSMSDSLWAPPPPPPPQTRGCPPRSAHETSSLSCACSCPSLQPGLACVAGCRGALRVGCIRVRCPRWRARPAAACRPAGARGCWRGTARSARGTGCPPARTPAPAAASPAQGYGG